MASNKRDSLSSTASSEASTVSSSDIADLRMVGRYVPALSEPRGRVSTTQWVAAHRGYLTLEAARGEDRQEGNWEGWCTFKETRHWCLVRYPFAYFFPTEEAKADCAGCVYLRRAIVGDAEWKAERGVGVCAIKQEVPVDPEEPEVGRVVEVSFRKMSHAKKFVKMIDHSMAVWNKHFEEKLHMTAKPCYQQFYEHSTQLRRLACPLLEVSVMV